jgi:cation/acetate symporter
LFLIGSDALCIGLGMVAGLVASVMLIAPFLRKFGAPTVPSYLGARFESSSVRLLAASIAAVPLMLLTLAEIKIAISMLSWLTALPSGLAAMAIIAILIVTITPGGVRSLSWSSAAQAIAILVAIMLPAAIVAVMETNLPFGQLSHGPIVRKLGRIEAEQGILVAIATPLALELPGMGLQPIAGRFASAFGSVGPIAFVLATFSILAGVAGSPSLLSRAVTSPSVYETRKSIGWAVALVGLLVMTLSSIAVFERDLLFTSLANQSPGSLPAGLQRLVDHGLAAIDGETARLTSRQILFERDGMLTALPILMGMPLAVVNLVAAGILAAALAGAAASLTQLGIVVGEDVVNAPGRWSAGEAQRIMVCRIALVAMAVLAGAGAVLARGDPLMLMLYAFSISGSTLLPVVLLSIWWKRMTPGGAIFGLAAGFATAVTFMVVADTTAFGVPAMLAPIAAGPLAIAAIIVATHLTPAPGRHILEMVRDLRVPGGETIHDREARQARQKESRAS